MEGKDGGEMKPRIRIIEADIEQSPQSVKDYIYHLESGVLLGEAAMKECERLEQQIEVLRELREYDARLINDLNGQMMGKK